MQHFRDSIDQFNAKGAVVLGVSQGRGPRPTPMAVLTFVIAPLCGGVGPDPVETHHKFKSQHALPFHLLSDPTVHEQQASLRAHAWKRYPTDVVVG